MRRRRRSVRLSALSCVWLDCVVNALHFVALPLETFSKSSGNGAAPPTGRRPKAAPAYLEEAINRDRFSSADLVRPSL